MSLGGKSEPTLKTPDQKHWGMRGSYDMRRNVCAVWVVTGSATGNRLANITEMTDDLTGPANSAETHRYGGSFITSTVSCFFVHLGSNVNRGNRIGRYWKMESLEIVGTAVLDLQPPPLSI